MEIGSSAARSGFGVGFARQVFIIDGVAVQLVADSGFATINCASNFSDTVALVV
jgi:hypothetical protein